MKKVIGLTLAISILAIGSMTAYAAPDARAAVHAASCADRDHCPGDGTCMNGQECTYPDCPNGGTHTYDASTCGWGDGQYGCASTGSQHHNSSGHGHGRGHH